MTLSNIKKAVILAGGKGTRLSEQTKTIPKPLVKIGDLPIMIHIMKRLRASGVSEFFILGGYLHEEIWSYLLQNIKEGTYPYPFSKEHLGLELSDEILKGCRVNLLFTGVDTGTAQRIKQVEKYINGENFIMTYGDSYSNVDVTDVERFLTEDKIMSLCAIPYKERFGLVEIDKNGNVKDFHEKTESATQFINGGYICMKSDIFNYILESDDDFSSDTMQSDRLKDKIGAYIHRGYWRAVDTQYDWENINKEYKENKEYFI